MSFDQITALGTNVILPYVSVNVFNENLFLKRTKERMKKFPGGNKIQFPVFNASGNTNDAEFFDKYDTVSRTPTDNMDAGVVAWRQLAAKVHISRKEILQNNGKTGAVRLMAAKGEFASREAARLWTLAGYSDGGSSTGANDTDQFDGLQAILSSSSDYAGITVASMADWAAKIDNNGGTNRDPSLDRMQIVYQACTDGPRRPTVILCNRGVFNNIWSLILPFQQIRRGEGEAGFQDADAVFNKTPIIVDPDMESNAMYMINEKSFYFAVHEMENGRKVKHGDLEDSNSMLLKTYWMGNYVCEERRSQGKYDDLNEASVSAS